MSRGDIFAGCPALEEGVFCSTYTCSVQHRVCRTTRLLLMKKASGIDTPIRLQMREKRFDFWSLDDHAPVDSQQFRAEFNRF